MHQQNEPKLRRPRERGLRPMAASVPLGIAVGTSIGALLGNPGIGAGLGLSAGLAIGALTETLRRRRNSRGRRERS